MIKYVNNESEFNKILEGNEKVLVDFFAVWCGPCQMLSPIVESFEKENDGIVVVKIDIDECMDLAMKYSIEAVPTLIVFESGKEVSRSLGLISKDELKKIMEG